MKDPQKILEDAIFNAVDRAIKKILFLVFVWFAIQLVFVFFSNSRDNTDGIERSGMKLRTDYGTGCQYLESISGSLTPRMDNGIHKGCRK